MDKLSLVGIALGLSAIVGGQYLEGGHIGSLLQPTALLIVVGGTLGAILLQTPSSTFLRGLRMARWVWFPPIIEQKKLIDKIVYWSHLSRKEGLLALENQIPGIKDEFTRKGLQLLIDGADPERLRDILDVEICAFEEEWRSAAKIWESAGGYSPTIGILGAVMGLIHVMENLSDPTKLGGGIAVAFVATIYGVGLANLAYLPIAGKLKHYITRMISVREMLIDGLVGIAVGDNPRIIESRLQGYIRQ